jgi:hypothetical protein
MSHPNPYFFSSDKQIGLVRCSRHVAEWIINKCSFVPVAGYSYGFQKCITMFWIDSVVLLDIRT